jgi:hypothetical protein
MLSQQSVLIPLYKTIDVPMNQTVQNALSHLMLSGLSMREKRR